MPPTLRSYDLKETVGHMDGVDECAELVEVESLPLVVALQSFLDAGNASGLAIDHVTSDATGPVVATFDVDVFHDYRARRPEVSFVRDHYYGFDAPKLIVSLMHDDVGSTYLLLVGPEPDTRWEAFARGVQEPSTRFNGDRGLSLGTVTREAPKDR